MIFQDILKRCLEMLNSDISDTETQPQPDVERGNLSSASSPCSVDIKAEPGGSLPVSPLCEGLLKIASPVKFSSSQSWPAGEGQVTAATPPPPLSPGPPVLEPMTTKPSSSVTTKQSAVSIPSSLSSNLTSSLASSLPAPPPPPALSIQQSMLPSAPVAPVAPVAPACDCYSTATSYLASPWTTTQSGTALTVITPSPMKSSPTSWPSLKSR